MEIAFTKNDKLFGKEGAYVSEFQITSDFNLHVERKKGGRFLVYQKTVENGEYDIVDGLGTQSHKDVIDIDMSALVYPKYIKVVSESEVTYAEVVNDGEVSIEGGGTVGGDTIMYYTCMTSDAPEVIVNLDTLDTIQPWGEVGIEETPMGLHPTMMPAQFYPRLAFLNVDVTVTTEDGSVLEPSQENTRIPNMYYIPVDSLPTTVNIKNNDTGKEYKIFFGQL